MVVRMVVTMMIRMVVRMFMIVIMGVTAPMIMRMIVLTSFFSFGARSSAAADRAHQTTSNSFTRMSSPAVTWT